MKSIAISLVTIFALSPALAIAQTSDDVILELLRSLEGPAVTTQVTSTAAAASASMNAPKPTAVATTSTTVQSEPLMPFNLFNVDGNVVKPDPNVVAMKSALDTLIAQLAALTSSKTQAPPVPAATSTVATTTQEVPAEPVAPPRFIFKKDLKQGSRGEEVNQLQSLLIARKMLFGEPTGYFGILTKTALITFQEELGLPGVGTVGPKTRAILNALPAQRFTPEPPAVTYFGTPSVPRISSSTSMSMNALSTVGTSTPEMGTSTPMFDYFAPPVSVSMSLLPTEAPLGGSTAITWLSQNAETCVASDGWEGSKATLGAARIEPLQFSMNFVLTCTGPGGIASTSALVVVGDEQ